jgi:hypothetical protein
VEGETFVMKAGDVCVHPPDAEHGGRTPTGFKGIDIFCPPREDYLELMKKHRKYGHRSGGKGDAGKVKGGRKKQETLDPDS